MELRGIQITMFSLTIRPFILVSSLLLALAACAPTVANRGYLLDPDKMAEVKVGTSTREEVVSKLGSPTQIGTFDENVWYYYGRSTEQYSFFDPEVVKQQAVELRFNDEGVLTALNKLDPAASLEINPVDRRTPTYGHETTFVEQLFGNLGRPGTFGKEKKK